MQPSAADIVRNTTHDPYAQARINQQKIKRQQQIKRQEYREKKNIQSQERVKRDKEAGRVQGTARVKAVLSGDTIVLVGVAIRGDSLPPEKVLTLSAVEAPRLGSGKNTKDQDFAYASRDFLRKKLIGKVVKFAIVYNSKENNRSYGNILLGKEDVTSTLVLNGLVLVKEHKNKEGKVPEDRQVLLDLQEIAKQRKVGIWSENVPYEKKVRKITTIDGNTSFNNARKFYEKVKGQPIRGIVEHVRDGSTLRIEMRDGPHSLKFTSVVLNLAGVSCPRVPLPKEVVLRRWEEKKSQNPDEDIKEPEFQEPEPYAVEAKFFVEMRMLHRDVQVTLCSIDKSGNIFGVVKVPQGNISVSLLKNGLGKRIEWSAELTEDAAALQAAEMDAKNHSVNMWRGYKPDDEKEQTRKDFTGTVVQILSGDTFMIRSQNKKTKESKEIRISLSSIRAPRVGGRSGKGEPFGADAKEFARRSLIGQRVRVAVEYERDPPEKSKNRKPRLFASVFQNKTNVAELIVSKGLAKVLQHRMDEDRSPFYDLLVAAEISASKRKIGIFSKETPTAKPIIDLSERIVIPKNEAERKELGEEKLKELQVQQKLVQVKIRQYLPFLRKHKRISGIVEYVFGGSRMKIYVPKENCIISFVIAGIRTPGQQRDPKTGKIVLDPFNKESTSFTRAMVLQHDVLIEVEDLDKGGNYIGNLFVRKKNFALLLLGAGLARVNRQSAEKSPLRELLWSTQNNARKSLIGLWKDWEKRKAEEEKRRKEQELLNPSQNSSSKLGNLLDQQFRMSICEIISPFDFYFRVANNPDAEVCDKGIAEAAEKLDKVEEPKKGGIYAGLFSDGQYYRVRVTSINKQAGSCEVFFMDFGNSDTVLLSNLVKLDPKVVSIAPQAKLGCLAGVRGAKDFAEQALDAFGSLVWEKPALGKVEYLDRGTNKHHVIVYVGDTLMQENVDAGDEKKENKLENKKISVKELDCVNEILLKEGVVRLPSHQADKKLKPLSNKWRVEEAYAKRNHLGIWTYGDVSSDEEEDKPGFQRNRNMNNNRGKK